ncbi:MAG: LLM class flavin-dependent oxidoreductase [Dehalococcoidia bacterium]
MSATLELISSISQFQPSAKNPDPSRAAAAARRAEVAGFDRLLVGYGSTRADGWITASFVLAQTTTMKILLAHRPGFMAPTVAARMGTTLDVYSQGRFSFNIITGGSPSDQRRDGDFVDHATRYARSSEYVDVMKLAWTAAEPFDFSGNFYRVERAWHDIKPVQQPYPPIYLGGSSEEAKPFAARHADVYMSWSEPVAHVRERVLEIRRLAAAEGRKQPGFSVSMRLILGETEEAAWSKARAMLPEGQTPKPTRLVHKEDAGRTRQLQLAAASEVHDERLWMGITALTDGQGSTGALVGTPEQCAESLLKYVEAGANALLLTGPDGAYMDLPSGLVKDLRSAADVILARDASLVS